MKQKESVFYSGAIPIKKLIDIQTVEPVEYNEKMYRYKDIDIDQIKIEKTDENNVYNKSSFQRDQDEDRIKEISEYIKSENHAVLPNSIIVSSQLKNDFLDEDQLYDVESLIDDNGNVESIEHEEWMKTFNSLNGVYLYNNNLYIPDDKSTMLLIDGQHRLYGIDHFINNHENQDFDLLVSFLLGYDNSILAQLFYTINYNQKAVNKSLLYHLSSEFSRDLSEIKLIHEYIRVLNENDKSPLKNKIKMLGTGDGFISQSFILESLLPLIMKKSKRSKNINVFRYYYLNENKQSYILKFLVKYFSVYKSILLEKGVWDKKRSFYTKTVGFGAIVKLIPDIILSLIDEIDHNEDVLNPDTINMISKEILKVKLQNITHTNEENYKGGSSLGLVSKLSNEWKVLLHLETISFDDVKYKKFVTDK